MTSKLIFNRLNTLVALLCFGIIITQCKNEKADTTIPFDSMLSLEVGIRPGENINPFTKEKYDFIGAPAAIGWHKDSPQFPFLIIGSGLMKGDQYSIYFVASISFDFLGESKIMGVSIPVEAKFRSVEIERFDQLNTEYVQVQLLINDWLENAFKDGDISNIRWKNEADIYRKMKETNIK